MRTVRGLRWYIAGLLCLATALNYLDRQALSVLAGTIKAELGMSTVEYSYITSAFLFSYMIMYAIGGRIVDALGTRRALAFFAASWSVASGLHAIARTALQFGVFRFLLGATEAANFPAIIKASAEWFPVRERALGIGIANAGSAVGAAVAAPLVSWVALTWGWRAAFGCSGVLGLLWVAVWWAVYRTPGEHRRLSPAELAWIQDDPNGGGAKPAAPRIGVLLRRRETWGCVIARALTDPISYFFVFWTPLYLQQARGFDLAAIGRLSWIPFVVLAFGNVAGGLIPRWLTAHGWTVNQARKTVMGVASLGIATSVLLLLRAGGPAAAITLISVALFCHGAWANMTLPAEVFPKHVVGSVSGIGGACGALVGALVTPLIGWVVQNISYAPVFAVIAVLPFTAWLLVCGLIRDLGVERQLGDHPTKAVNH